MAIEINPTSVKFTVGDVYDKVLRAKRGTNMLGYLGKQLQSYSKNRADIDAAMFKYFEDMGMKRGDKANSADDHNVELETKMNLDPSMMPMMKYRAMFIDGSTDDDDEAASDYATKQLIGESNGY